jgi:hypothetical protein
MAQVPVSMQVTIYPRDKSVKPYPATIVGYAWLTGVGVGGGPMPGGGGDPPHIDHTLPGDQPGISHPIVLPPVDVPPPVNEAGGSITITIKEAPPSGGWGLNLDEGWYYSPGTGQAGPKRR